MSQIKVSAEYIEILPMNQPVDVQGTQVTLIDANQ